MGMEFFIEMDWDVVDKAVSRTSYYIGRYLSKPTSQALQRLVDSATRRCLV